MSGADRAAENGVLSPRRVLTREQSSDLAFLHTVLDATQRLVQQTAAASEGGVARVLDTRLSGSGANRIKVDCVQCDVPARRVSVSRDGGRWAVEHMVGGHISVIRNGAAAAVAGLQGATDVRCAWWIADSIVGVVAVAPAADVLWVYAIDALDGAVSRTELVVPARARIGPVVAQGSVMVCADSSTGALSLWDFDAVRGSRLGLSVARTGCIEGGPDGAVVVDLRWVEEGIGLAATRAGGAFWFDVRRESSHLRRAPLSRLEPGRRLGAGLSAATVLSWRWQEAVVAVAGNAFPPRCAALCLPSATGVAFHSIGESLEDSVVHTRTFERGWVWLCGSSMAYAVLSASRRQATVCRMPGGEPLYTLETGDGAVIQDGWMMCAERNGMAVVACAISTGGMVYLLSFELG
ncbi:hypothetical protein IWW37_004002 [Coemansia sp. RSA 2050]|nr:hypothetical protein IWW37_004002 [Coemansia sp. RSA 2050]KAJ2732457.1 hypothetical protein IW152_003788 [Coemansia sp. BCRC 34962]